MIFKSLLGNYQLLDTGHELKLEKFGSITICRPCRTAIWSKSLSEQVWESADATYNHKDGWTTNLNNELPKTWNLGLNKYLSVELFLQDNGQIGIFPEHLTYLPDISFSRKPTKVLNLFGYTGIASIFCSSLGADVTHVDISKSVLNRFNTNLDINKQIKSSVRIIKEDALKFTQKEIKRGNSYDVIIADPPGFSRSDSKRNNSKSWSISSILPDIICNMEKLIIPNRGKFILTCHQPEINSEVIANLCLSNMKSNFDFIYKGNLSLQECSLSSRSFKSRTLQCGSIVSVKLI